MDLLEAKEIDVQGFLSRTLALNDRFKNQDLFNNFALENEGIRLEDMAALSISESSVFSNDSNLSQMAESEIIQQNPCYVCLVSPKSVLLRPCNHLNVCNQCWDCILQKAQATETQLKCPTCNQLVTEAIRNVYIYT